MSQPEEVYSNNVNPNTITRQPSSHSNGSFGSVFIVLAVIVVISAIACFLGRLCNHRYQKRGETKAKHSHHDTKGKQNHKQNHNVRPREREPMQKPHNQHGFHSGDGDIEFGFDKGIPGGKPKFMGNGSFKGGPKPSENGEIRGEMRFPNNGEMRFPNNGEFRPGV